MSVGACLSKFGLTILNLLFLAAGMAMIILGAVMIKEVNSYYVYNEMRSFMMAMLPAAAILAAGVMALVLAFFGCIATCKRNKCLHGTYFTLLLLMFVALIIGVVLGAIYRGKIESGLKDIMKDSMNQYANKSEIAANVDMVQREFKCCGVDGSADWLETDWYKKHMAERPEEGYPESCCVNDSCTYGKDDKQLHGEGCYVLVMREFNHYFKIIAACIGAFAFILVVGMVLNCVLVMQKRRERMYDIPYRDLNDEQRHRDGMRI